MRCPLVGGRGRLHAARSSSCLPGWASNPSPILTRLAPPSPKPRRPPASLLSEPAGLSACKAAKLHRPSSGHSPAPYTLPAAPPRPRRCCRRHRRQREPLTAASFGTWPTARGRALAGHPASHGKEGQDWKLCCRQCAWPSAMHASPPCLPRTARAVPQSSLPQTPVLRGSLHAVDEPARHHGAGALAAGERQGGREDTRTFKQGGNSTRCPLEQVPAPALVHQDRAAAALHPHVVVEAEQLGALAAQDLKGARRLKVLKLQGCRAHTPPARSIHSDSAIIVQGPHPAITINSQRFSYHTQRWTCSLCIVTIKGGAGGAAGGSKGLLVYRCGGGWGALHAAACAGRDQPRQQAHPLYSPKTCVRACSSAFGQSVLTALQNSSITPASRAVKPTE